MPIFINDESVNPRDVLVALRMTDNQELVERLDPKKKKRNFQLSNRVPDPLNPGRFIRNKSISMQPVFDVYVPSLNDTVSIRYSVSKAKRTNPITKATDMVYTTKSVVINDDFFTADRDDEFMFYLLNPNNADSPFCKDAYKATYKIQDSEMDAKKGLVYDMAYAEVSGMIIGRNAIDVRKLRTLAKGMGLVTGIDTSDDEVRALLIAKAKESPYKLQQKLDSFSSEFEGAVQDAIDKKILYTQEANGMLRWYLNGEEILPIRDLQVDVNSQLKDYITLNIQTLYPKIEESLAKYDRVSKLDTMTRPAHEATPATPVDLYANTPQGGNQVVLEKPVVKRSGNPNWTKK